MKIIDNTPREVAPKGKRRIIETAWGNTHGYIAGRFWKTIGITHEPGTKEAAEAFLAGKDD